MTAKKGTHSFTSKESALSEKTSQEIFNEVLLLEEFKDFTVKKSYSINEVYGTNKACTFKGKDSLCYPDFGIVSYKGKYVAIGDNKYQKTRQNVVERINLYSTDIVPLGIKPENLFIVYDGPGFDKDKNGNMPGSTGKQYIRSLYKKHTVLLQPSKKELYEKVYLFFKRIKEEENIIKNK
jgi:hypothetical protein